MTAAVAPRERALACTACGAPLTLRSERAETVVCPSCGAQLDLRSAGYAALEQLRRRPDDTPLKVGLSGRLDGIAYTVAGFLRWRDPDDAETYWDDWFLVAEGGRTGWLRSDGYSFRLCHVVRPEDAEPVHLQTLDPESQYVTLDGERHLVLERDRAVVEYLEGELLWTARAGETVVVLRCDPDISVEVGPTRVRYFCWSPVPWQNVAEGFGVPDAAARPDDYVIRPAPKRKAPPPGDPIASYEVPGFVPPSDDGLVWHQRPMVRLAVVLAAGILYLVLDMLAPPAGRKPANTFHPYQPPVARPYRSP